MALCPPPPIRTRTNPAKIRKPPVYFIYFSTERQRSTAPPGKTKSSWLISQKNRFDLLTHTRFCLAGNAAFTYITQSLSFCVRRPSIRTQHGVGSFVPPPPFRLIPFHSVLIGEKKLLGRLACLACLACGVSITACA